MTYELTYRGPVGSYHSVDVDTEDEAMVLAREAWEADCTEVSVLNTRTEEASVICEDCGGWRDPNTPTCEQCDENRKSWGGTFPGEEAK